MLLHYADLAAGWAAGGAPLAGLILGSEFPGLTQVRDEAGGYPAVASFRSLASAVRARLGSGTALVYAADWTEYGAHVRDGGATVRFPLDALFADPAIDAVGIDFYPPLSDWREGRDHADAGLADAVTDTAYLRSRLGAGEAFDWYYASGADRAAQVTCAQGLSATRPVRGSMMWCRSSPSERHVRARVDEVAKAWLSMRTTSARSSMRGTT